MPYQERPETRDPERGNLLVVDPADLMRDNPAALIINQESYERMLGFFSAGPDGQFDPPISCELEHFLLNMVKLSKILF